MFMCGSRYCTLTGLSDYRSQCGVAATFVIALKSMLAVLTALKHLESGLPIVADILLRGWLGTPPLCFMMLSCSPVFACSLYHYTYSRGEPYKVRNCIFFPLYKQGFLCSMHLLTPQSAGPSMCI